MNYLQEIAITLGRGIEKKADRGYMTLCPCCGSSTANLKLWRTEIGDIRGKCINGCRTRDVLTEVRNLEKKIAAQPPGSNMETDSRVMGITETELLQKDILEPRLLLHPFLTEECISMLYAGKGTGKTWLGIDIGIALSRDSPTGIKIGPWEVKNGCGVLYVDGELPESRIRKVIKLLTKGMGDRGECSKTNELRIFSAIAKEKTENTKYNLKDEGFRNRITTHFDTKKSCRLLILDNITSLTSGIPLSSQQHWDPINDWLKYLRGRGISTIMIHHTNKSGEYLGTSSLDRHIDTTIRVDRVGEEADQVCLKIKFDKCRDMSPGQGKSFTLQLVGDEKSGLKFEQITA